MLKEMREPFMEYCQDSEEDETTDDENTEFSPPRQRQKTEQEHVSLKKKDLKGKKERST
jgi:hypothetical protein